MESVALVVPVSPEPEAVPGGAEGLYDALQRALQEQGFRVERVSLSMDERTWATIPPAYQRAYQLDLNRFDWVLSTKPPTYLVRHPRHVVYLLHPMRVFYDRWDGTHPERKQLIQTLDRKALEEIPPQRRFCIGQTVARRMKEHLGLDFQVLHPAPPRSDVRCGPYEHFFTCSRLHPWKRLDLLIKAMKHYPGGRRLIIAGDGPERANLHTLASDDRRIELAGFVPPERLTELYSQALAVPFLPIEEDFGYVVIEAALAEKPVITCTDSGEPAAWIQSRVTGLVVDATPGRIAQAMVFLDRHPELARQWGAAARQKAQQLRWDSIVQTLWKASQSGGHALGDRPVSRAVVKPASRRIKILCTDNQVLLPAIGGGRVRNYYLLKALAEYFDVLYVGTYDWAAKDCVFRRENLSEHFAMVLVPATVKHLALDNEIRAKVGQPVYDITFPRLGRYTPAFERVIRQEAGQCQILLCTHPWSFPFLPKTDGQVLIYDAHNCEYEVKRQILGSRRSWRVQSLLFEVKQVEGNLCRQARRVFVCSPEDGEYFSRFYGISPEKIRLVPNGVDTGEIIPAQKGEKTALRAALGLPPGPLVVFMGSGYPPNTEAVEWIAMQLALKLPQVHFVIIGSVCDTFKDAVHRRVASGGRVKTIFANSPIPDNVRLWGVVDPGEKSRLLASADVAVNPMFRGGGSNMKMLDFMAAGLPVVSTPVGARGLQLADGREACIVEPENMAQAVAELLAQPERCRLLGLQARRKVEQEYAWPTIAARAARYIEESLREAAS